MILSKTRKIMCAQYLKTSKRQTSNYVWTPPNVFWHLATFLPRQVFS